MPFCTQSVIEDFVTQSTHEHEEFQSGLCAAFAWALADTARQHGEDAYVSILIRLDVEDDGEVYAETFSHCVAVIGDQAFDIEGADADERWIGKWGDEPDKWGMVTDWEYKDFSLSDWDAFSQICRESRVCLEKTADFARSMSMAQAVADDPMAPAREAHAPVLA